MMENNSVPTHQASKQEKGRTPIDFVQPEDIKMFPNDVEELIGTLDTRADYYDSLEDQALVIARMARTSAREIRKARDNIREHFAIHRFRRKQRFDSDLKKFIREFCTGKEYDSCVNSPCTHASQNGCTHPEHPKNKGGRVNLEGI